RSVCAVTLPTQKKRWLDKALPFAVEEWLAEEVEDFHLALGERLDDGRHRVVAVRRDWLRGWLDACGANPPRAIRVDADLLPGDAPRLCRDRKSTRLNSSHVKTSYAVFCLKKKKRPVRGVVSNGMLVSEREL